MRLHFARDALLSARGLTRVTYVRQEPGKSRRKCGVLARTRSERETKFLCVRFCPVVPRPAWGRAALSRRGTGVARRGAADLHHQRSARRHARALSFQIPMQSSSSSGLAGSSALAVGHMAAAWQHTTTSALVSQRSAPILPVRSVGSLVFPSLVDAVRNTIEHAASACPGMHTLTVGAAHHAALHGEAATARRSPCAHAERRNQQSCW